MNLQDITMHKTRLRQVNAPIENLESAVRAAVCRLEGRVTPGMRVALGVGSRGINNIAAITRHAVDELKRMGAAPFIVPAMGSHGGGTGEGQAQLLAEYGICRETMGVDVVSSMETVCVARLDGEPRLPVFMDKAAHGADGVVVINRVKPHTDFHGPHESGIVKMLVIGLGKQAQAEQAHSYGAAGLREYIPLLAQKVLESGKILGGLALLEDGYDQTSRVQMALPEDFFKVDADFLAQAYKTMARLPFDELDVLIVDEMGKDISGTCMDTNVIGRMRIMGEEEGRPACRRIVVLSLTPGGHGNALGVGLADVVTKRLADAIDWDATYNNILTAGFFERGFLPIVRPTDEMAIYAAVNGCARHNAAALRVARIRNTLRLDEAWLSPALVKEVLEKGRGEATGISTPMAFDEKGVVWGFS